MSKSHNSSTVLQCERILSNSCYFKAWWCELSCLWPSPPEFERVTQEFLKINISHMEPSDKRIDVTLHGNFLKSKTNIDHLKKIDMGNTKMVTGDMVIS